MPVKGIIFDLGSTLMYIDGEWEEIRAQNAANLLAFLQAEGLDLEEEPFRDALRRQGERGWATARATRVEYLAEQRVRETLAELGHPHLDGHLLAQGVKAFFRHEEARWTAFPDAVPTLEALHGAGYRVGLISNASDDGLIQRLVRNLGFEPYLNPALNSAGVGIRKPDPRIFQLVLEEWGLEPVEVAMVGDTLTADILGAQLSGMRSVLALMDENPGNGQWREQITPDATIEALAELPALLATV
jgi:HAD superfamily hydrolase (TIGR01662 family)